MQDEQATVGKRIEIVDVLRRPGISDAVCLGLLLVGSLAGTVLEPSHRDFWVGFPLIVEVPLLCTSLLLMLSRIAARNRVAWAVGSTGQ